MGERHPAICSPEAIAACYRPGLRIVWEQDGLRDVWEVVATDESTATTRFIAADGDVAERTASFEQLSMHSAFPVGTSEFIETDVETPAGLFRGTECIVATPEGVRRFFFSAAHPGPPIRITGPGFLRQQVERSDM